jgi:hypothetical protein
MAHRARDCRRLLALADARCSLSSCLSLRLVLLLGSMTGAPQSVQKMLRLRFSNSHASQTLKPSSASLCTIGETSHLGQPFGLSSLYQSHLSAASSRRSIALVHTSHTVRHSPRVTRG